MLERAREAGMRHIITVGAGADSSEAAADLAESRPGFLSATAGIHPHEAGLADAAARARVERLVAGKRVVAVGEAGLDYHSDSSSRLDQYKVFEWQIELALGAGLPLVVHCRDALDDCMEILERQSGRGLRGVAHCFSGTPEQARRFIEIGFHISFSGTITYPSAAVLRDAVRVVPEDRLLLETDCPWLAPQPRRGQRNEPAFLRFTAEVVDKVRGVLPGESAGIAMKNTIALFQLAGFDEARI